MSMHARITNDSPRRAKWMRMFAAETVPILEPPLHDNDGRPRFLIDVSGMSHEIVVNVAREFSRAWKIPMDRLVDDITSRGSVALSGDDIAVVEES